jgi:hypothetical protein
MTRTGNVVNVGTVGTSPTIDNPEDHPMACGQFGFRALEKTAASRIIPRRRRVWQWWVLKFEAKANNVEPSHQLALVKRKIEGMAVYGI